MAKPAMKVAAICGSLRKASCNRGILRCAVELCNESIEAVELCNESIEDMQIEIVDISALPFVNTDLEVDGTYPPAVEEFRRTILEADSILFGFPEYNYSLPAPLKNAIDWASRPPNVWADKTAAVIDWASRPPNVWADKTAAIITAAGGTGGKSTQYHLRQVGVFLDLHFINKPEIFIVGRGTPRRFDDDGNLVDPAIKEQLKQLLISLQAFTRRLHRDS